jgi:histidinol phosphatase-like PHP family hydrolase
MADIIAHPLVAKTGVLAFEPERLIAELTPERLAPVLTKAAQRGTAMELNPWLVAQFPGFYAVFIAACKEQGVRFALGSDAHRLENIPYAENGVHRGAGPGDLEALGVRESDLLDPAAVFPRRG